MTRMPLFLVATAALALAGCGNKAETETPEKTTKVSIDINSEDGAPREGVVNIDGDTESGKFEIKLPGGLEAKVKIPEGMAGKSKFDIDGVGLYPGAKIGSIKVRATEKGGDSHATVEMGFAAPADAAAVADWYEQEFAAKKVTVARSGDTLTGKTRDGDNFTLALAAAETGKAKGTLTIVNDDNKGVNDRKG
jgi:hypothetical protein